MNQRKKPRAQKRPGRKKPPAAEFIDVSIDRIAYQGKGIASLDDKICFVSDSVPGDLVTARVKKRAKKYIDAEFSALVKKSPLRDQSVDCPYFARCGGCQWLDIDYEQQLQWKSQFLDDAIERIAKLDCKAVTQNIQEAPQIEGYRSRIRLKVLAPKKNLDRRIGFFQRASHELVAVDSCLIADPAVNHFIHAFNAYEKKQGYDQDQLHIREISLQVTRDEKSKLLVELIPATNSSDTLKKRQQWFKGLSSHCKTTMELIGQEISSESHIYDQQNGVDFYTDGKQFQQVHVAANHFLREKILGLVQSHFKSKIRVLDLYCGSANLSLLLAHSGHQVLGLEISAEAIESAKVAASRNRLENCQFHCSPASQLQEYVESHELFDLLIVDPPRRGLSDDIEVILGLEIENMIYVSCDPTTLARDLKIFVEQGYEVQYLQAMDFFPHSFHVESICFLSRRKL